VARAKTGFFVPGEHWTTLTGGRQAPTKGAAARVRAQILLADPRAAA
jgi:hypothetical protein